MNTIALPPKQLSTVLASYLQIPLVNSIQFDKKLKSFTMEQRGNRSSRKGLIPTLKSYYYPQGHPSLEKKRKKYQKGRVKKGSNSQVGTTVDNQICQYIKSEFKKYPKHKFAKALLEFWKEHDQVPIAAQVPVYIEKFQCITQADVITRSPDGQLWVNEIKTGYPRSGYVKKGTFNHLLEVPNTRYNQWFLQCTYTTMGLRTISGDKYKGVIIQIYEDKKKGVVVKKLKHPKWITQLLT